MSGSDGFPAAPPANPPGASALSWRLGTYAEFRDAMLAAVPVQTVPEGGSTAPLAALNVRDPGDFGVALLGAWAVVGDVLSFYQERILNEGYLRTATETRSVRALLDLTGYRTDPGVAASTALAFTVSPAPGASGGLVVPPGSAAQSVPGAGETPQTFETAAAVTTRAEWNALAPAIGVRTVAQALSAGDASLRLAGTRTGLRPGDPLLLDDEAGAAWALSFVQGALADAKDGCTTVTLSAPADGGASGALDRPRATAFRKRLTPFGHDAVPWAKATDAARRAAMDPAGGVFRLDAAQQAWTGANAGLPMAEVRAVLAASTGVWLAAVAGMGVYASRDGGASWAPSGTGMPRAEVYALAEGPRGALYAGTAGGNVLRSRDGGASWDAVAGRTTVRAAVPVPPAQPVVVNPAAPETAVPAEAAAGTLPVSVPARLPSTIVRTLLAWTESDGSVSLAAGTDSGVYTASDGVGAWTAVNAVAGQTTAGAGGLADTSVYALARDASGALLAGTTAGVFLREGETWTPVNWNLPGTDPASRFSTLAAASVVAGVDGGAAAWWIATPQGVWRADPAAQTWTAASQGLPAGTGGAPAAVQVLLGGASLAAATEGGVFASGDGGRSWTEVAPTPAGAPPPPPSAPGLAPAPPGLNNPEVRALSGTPGGALLAATPFLGFLDAATGAPQAEWPDFEVRGLTVDLDGRQPGVVPESRIALWQGTVDGASTAAVATVLTTEVTTRADFGLEGTVTRLTLRASDPLPAFDPRATSVFASSEALALDVRTVADPAPVTGACVAFLPAGPPLPAGQLLALTGAPSRVALVPRAGVLALEGGGWRPAGLAGLDVRALAVSPAGAVWAGTAEGVFTVDDPASASAAAWAAAGAGAPPADVRAVAFTASGDAVLGTAGGVVAAVGEAGTWTADPGYPGGAVEALAVAADGTLWAASSTVYRRASAEAGWAPGPPGLDGAAVAVLAAEPGGDLYAGSDAGVFRLAAGARAWNSESAGLASSDVRALAVAADGQVYAGTAGGGVFRAPAGGGRWEPVAPGSLGNRDVRALAVGAGGEVYAGTYGGGVWLLPAAASAWTRLPTGAGNHVAALAVDGEGGAWAGCGAAPVLRSPDGLSTREAPLRWVASLPRSAAAELDRGGVTESVRGALAAEGMAVGASAYLDVRAAGSAWTLVQPSGAAFLDLQPAGIDVRVPASLPVLAAGPSAAPVAGNGAADGGGGWVTCATLWPDGFVGELDARADEALPQPSAAGDATVAEVATVTGTGDDGAVRLAAPLARAYDPATVSATANVVHSTQGATVRDEVLGSGDSARRTTRFTLRLPLAYTPAPTPTGGATTLTVRVNGAAWREVDSLLGQPPDARVYQVITGPGGAATVAFGDGENGARPPTGHENVRATYRTGAGASGNVEAGQVSVLRSRPAGVRRVGNPLPGSGGIAPEDAAAARAAAPLRLRALDRVVSARDYASFSRVYPGVSRARADTLPGAGAPLVVTTAGAGGAVPDAGLLAGLAAAIDANRLNAVPFRVLPFEPRYFQLRARLVVDPAYAPDAVAAAAEAALRADYAFSERDFAQPVLLSELVVAAQRVEGVLALEADALFVTGLTPRVHPRLEAAPARRDPDTGLPRGAQLLLPHPDLGFTLTPVPA